VHKHTKQFFGVQFYLLPVYWTVAWKGLIHHKPQCL